MVCLGLLTSGKQPETRWTGDPHQTHRAPGAQGGRPLDAEAGPHHRPATRQLPPPIGAMPATPTAALTPARQPPDNGRMAWGRPHKHSTGTNAHDLRRQPGARGSVFVPPGEHLLPSNASTSTPCWRERRSPVRGVPLAMSCAWVRVSTRFGSPPIPPTTQPPNPLPTHPPNARLEGR